MALSILGYLIVMAAALYWGERLYGSKSAAIVLALVSPIPFAFLAPLITLCILFLFGRFLRLLNDSPIDLENEWIQGAGTLIAAIICAYALRHFAKTEGAKKQSNQSPETTTQADKSAASHTPRQP